MKTAAIALLSLVLAGCGQTYGVSSNASGAVHDLPSLQQTASSKIHHVVIIFQENRSVDNLFHGLAGADTARSGKNSEGKTVTLQPEALAGTYDESHDHNAFQTEVANGLLDGFDLVGSACKRGKQCPPKDVRAYRYVPHDQVAPYFQLATTYAFADRMFQTNQGPSFPAHQYIVSGTSTISDGSPLRASSNAFAPAGGFTGGCDSPVGSFVRLIDEFGSENQTAYPCFDRLSLMTLLDRKSLSWRYYLAKLAPGLWNAPDALAGIRASKSYATHVVGPPSAVLTDISAGRLADVVWVTPTAAESDHAGLNTGLGPSWVASVVNAIGTSAYWNDTAIFITWDDWGGWYDHVPPQQYNSYELGFRVPLIVVSPYARRHYVSHRRHEFGSLLKFVEETFGLPSMHTTDERADDLADCFDFSKAPASFRTIAAPYGREYFLRQPVSSEAPDDD
ncbi:MAG: hypothetical protein JOZ77_06450 [Candidatus Eremiobacteraeota bacterium]|nr:hypothetical protein [Candidatus Eremiobacteraeota bacterium]